MPLSTISTTAKRKLAYKETDHTTSNKILDALVVGYDSGVKPNQTQEKRSEKNFETLPDTGNALENFSAICRLAAKQRNTLGSAKEGFTKSLEILLDIVKANFSTMTPEEKTALGLQNKKSSTITHYDLMEVGLFGTVSDKKDKTIAQIKTLQQNMENAYSATHIVLKGEYTTDINSQNSVPDRIKQGKEEVTAQQFFNHDITFKTTEVKDKTFGIVMGNTTAIIRNDVKPQPQQPDKEAIFVAKVNAALQDYEKISRAPFGIGHSSESTALKKELQAAMRKEAPSERYEMVVEALRKHEKLGGSFEKCLNKYGVKEDLTKRVKAVKESQSHVEARHAV